MPSCVTRFRTGRLNRTTGSLDSAVGAPLIEARKMVHCVMASCRGLRLWRPSTNRIHGSAAPAPSKIPKTTLGEASSRNLQTLTSVLLRHSVSPLAIESTQGLVGCLLPMQARRHVKQATLYGKKSSLATVRMEKKI